MSVQGGSVEDQALPGTANAEGWRRLHPISPLLRGGIVLIVVIGILISNLRDRLIGVLFVDRVAPGVEQAVEQSGDVLQLVEFLVDRGLLFLLLGGTGFVLAVIIGSFWLAWRFSTYRITDDAVEARHGVLFRTHRRAPLERIQSVNLQRSLIARAVGVTKIEVLTGGQGGKVELSYLGFRDAKVVREQIIRRSAAKRDGLDPSGVPVAEAMDAPVQHLRDRATDFLDADIDPASIASGELVSVPVSRLAGSVALGWEVIAVVGFAILATVGAVTGVFKLFIADEASVGGLWLAVVFASFPMMFVFGMIAFTQFNKGFKFTLARSADSVRTSGGLTATATETIPFGRVHAVEALQPLLWRPFGWWKVRITLAGHSVAQGGQNGAQNVVLPVGSVDDVLRVFETLLPSRVFGAGSEADEEVARAEHDAELIDGLTGSGHGYLGAGSHSAWVLLLGKSRAGIAIADRGLPEATLRIRRGVLTRSLSVMPMVRAQSVLVRRPLVQRFLGLATVQAHTVLGPVRMVMRGLETGAAYEFFDELTDEMLRAQSVDSAQGGGRAS